MIQKKYDMEDWRESMKVTSQECCIFSSPKNSIEKHNMRTATGTATPSNHAHRVLLLNAKHTLGSFEKRDVHLLLSQESFEPPHMSKTVTMSKRQTRASHTCTAPSITSLEKPQQTILPSSHLLPNPITLLQFPSSTPPAPPRQPPHPPDRHLHRNHRFHYAYSLLPSYPATNRPRLI